MGGVRFAPPATCSWFMDYAFRRLAMLNRSAIFAALLTLSSLALAQQHATQGTQRATASPNATTTCAATFTSGTGRNTTKYCVTTNGNITQFSRGNDEYIQVGDVSEGYGFCDS